MIRERTCAQRTFVQLKKIAFSIFAFFAAATFFSCDSFDNYFDYNIGGLFESYGNVATVTAVQYSRPPVESDGKLNIDSSADFTVSYLIDNPGNFTLYVSGYSYNSTLTVQNNRLITRTVTASQLESMEQWGGGIATSLTIMAITQSGNFLPQSSYTGPEIYCNSPPPKINNALGQMQTDPAASINERLVIAFQLPPMYEIVPSTDPSIPPTYKSKYNDWKSLVVTDKRTGTARAFDFECYDNVSNFLSKGTIADGTTADGWVIHNSSNPPSPLGPTYSGGPSFSPSMSEGDTYYIVTDIDNLSSLEPFQIELTIKDSGGMTNPVEISSHAVKLLPPTCNISVASVINTLDQAYVEFIIHAPANSSDATLHFAITNSNGDPVADTSGSESEHVGDATFRLYPKTNGSAETYTIGQAYATKVGWGGSDDAASTFGSGGTITVTGAQLSAPTCNLVDGQTYPQETELVITSPEAADVGWMYNIGGGAFITGSAPSPASITLEEAGAYAFALYAQKEYYEKSATVNLSCSVALTALYVADYGSDSNAGTKAYPFETIQHAIDTFAAGSTPASPANTIYILTDMTSINGLTSMGSGYVNIVGCKGGASGVPGTPVALACAHDVTVIGLSGGTMSLRAISITGIDGTSNGAVNFAGGTLILKDKVTITGNKKSDGTAMNVNIGSGVITVDANGISGTKVGVTSASAPSLGNPVEITSGYGASVSATDNPALHFASDNASYGIGLNAAGTEAALVTGGGGIDLGEIYSVSFQAAVAGGKATIKAKASTSSSPTPVDITDDVDAWSVKLFYLNTYTGVSSSGTTAAGGNVLSLAGLGAGTYIAKASATYGGKTYSGEVEVSVAGPTTGMVLIPHGSFKRAKNAAAVTSGDVYTITLTKDFYICDHEVTQKEWAAVMGNTQADLIAAVSGGSDKGSGDDYPVYYVNWYHAIAYCNKLSIKEGKTPCYSVSGVTDWAGLAFADIPTSTSTAWDSVSCNWSANGYRLPTEAEWEYAALGDYKDNPNWNGYGDASNPSAVVFAGYNGSNSIGDYAWYSDNASSKTHEVKQKFANSHGLCDMSGNIYEWCWDWYGFNQYDTDGNASDPLGASPGSLRVGRGGSWGANTVDCSVAYRFCNNPNVRTTLTGFRVVRNAP